jgi:hypothetical protein
MIFGQPSLQISNHPCKIGFVGASGQLPYKSTICSNGLVEAANQTIATNALELPLKIHSGIVWDRN